MPGRHRGGDDPIEGDGRQRGRPVPAGGAARADPADPAGEMSTSSHVGSADGAPAVALAAELAADGWLTPYRVEAWERGTARRLYPTGSGCRPATATTAWTGPTIPHVGGPSSTPTSR